MGKRSSSGITNNLNSNGQAIDKMHPDKIAGVLRSKSSMSFDEADNGAANPNPNNDLDRMNNCQSVVVANEMRLRGYDVQAKGWDGSDGIAKDVALDPALAWIDPATGKKPEMQELKQSYDATTILNALENNIKQGERYAVGFMWKNGGSHIINIDRDSKGRLRLKDNQRQKGEQSEWIGKTNVKKFFQNVRTGNVYTPATGLKYAGPKLLRLDNLAPNTKVMNQILERK